ncbi:MAG: hypothetical protein KAF27_06330 [Porphyrobacter sp.]|nr:hypothetical protein [Porphyrobacter sp.]
MALDRTGAASRTYCALQTCGLRRSAGRICGPDLTRREDKMGNIGTSAVVAALVSLAIVAGHLAFQDAADAKISDGWLGFLGALVGAGLAVFGAVYVERVKQRDAREENLGLLADALERLAVLVSELRTDCKDITNRKALLAVPQAERDALLEKHNSALFHMTEARFAEIADQVDFIEYYADKQPVGSSTLWSQLRRIDRAYKQWRPTLGDLAQLQRSAPDQAHAEAEKIEQMCRALVIPTDEALKELNRKLSSKRRYSNLHWKQLEPSMDKEARLVAHLPRQIINRTRAIRLR